MTGETSPKNSDYEVLVSTNKQKVEEFAKEYAAPTKVGMCSLDLIDLVAHSPIRVIDECDEVNRNMLDELYFQLGVDIASPTIISRERFRPHRIIYRATLHELGDGNVIREQQITTDSQTSFSVDVGHGVLLN